MPPWLRIPEKMTNWTTK